MESIKENNNFLILLAEDSPTQAAKLEFLLTEHGYRVLVAGNGTIALELIIHHKPDLVISDILMPEMDGFELCNSVKGNPSIKHIPIILLTTLSESENIIRAVDAGADFFFTKPCDEDHLLTKVDYIFENYNKNISVAYNEGEDNKAGNATSQRQMINLLVSTYEHVKLHNTKLKEAQMEIRNLNDHLNEKVIEKTISLQKVIDELKIAETELIKARDKAEESNRLKSSLLSNMSHELRTPMNGIMGFSSLLKESLTNPENKKMAGSIQRSANRLMDTLNSIMDLSQLQADKTMLQFEIINVNKEISDVIYGFQEQAISSAIELILDIPSEVNCYADKTIFRKTIQILVDNAIKFTPKGSVKISASYDSDSLVLIDVNDTGIGIASENLGLIFDEFKQLSSGFGRSYEGNGLGLTLCKKFTHLLKGTIDVKSTLGEGSVFSIKIPASNNNSDISAPKVLETNIPDIPFQKVHKVTNNKPFVLIVEDNDLNTQLVEIYLEKFCTTESAFSGELAIQKAREKQFDLILMDINLGAGLNGMQAATEIRTIKGYEKLPIIAVTGYTSREEQLKVTSNGCSHFLPKPFKREQLISLINNVMNIS